MNDTHSESVFSYDKLWKLLMDRRMRKKDLQLSAHISPAVIAKMAKICFALKCDLTDVVEINRKRSS